MALQREVMDNIHDGYFGETKSVLRARSSVYWPGFENEIRNLMASCSSRAFTRLYSGKGDCKTDNIQRSKIRCAHATKDREIFLLVSQLKEQLVKGAFAWGKWSAIV